MNRLSDTGAAAQSERVGGDTGNLLALMNERDRRYSDRFIAEREFVLRILQDRDAIYDERDQRYTTRGAADREYLDAKIKALADEFHSLSEAQKEAITKAEDATNIRLEAIAKFRDDARVESATFVTKGEADVRFAAITTRMDETQQAVAEKIESGLNALAKQITELSKRLDVSKGRGIGLENAWGYLLGSIGFIAAIIAIFLQVTS